MEKFFNINEAGSSISCKLYCKDIKAIKRIVIYGHGFGGHKDNKAAERFAEYVMKKHKDIAVITFNAPCHGDDVKKKLILDDCGKYINTVVKYACERYKVEEIYSYSTSFGSYQILKYIAENGNPFRKIAMRCPAVNMYDVLSAVIMNPADVKALSRNKPVLVGFDRKIKVTQSFLDELKEADLTKYDYHKYADDILILQGTSDEVVSPDVVKAFAEDNSIRCIPMEGADHRFQNPRVMDEAIKLITEFFGF